YKDYFYILNFSKNTNLDDYIYNIIINQLKEYLKNIKCKKQISTLGKWLPREKSEINKKINFIDKFNSKFYPDFAIYSARKRYRKLKSMLNKNLGTLEVNLCAKNYDKID